MYVASIESLRYFKFSCNSNSVLGSLIKDDIKKIEIEISSNHE